MLYLIPNPRHLISDTGICHVILITWYLTPVLVMLCLSLDIWHRYLPCYAYHLISNTDTCHAILDTWYLTPALNMLSPGINSLDLILWHLTGYYTPDTCISLHIHDYHFYGDLIIILSQDIWYSWTPVLLNSCIPEPLKKGDSWYYTPVDPRNRITMNIGLLWTPCGHYH